MNDLVRSRLIAYVTFFQIDVTGLPDFYKAPTTAMKLIWGGILLTVSCLLIYFSIYQVMEFCNNPILTSINIEADPNGAEFPEIYICPNIPTHYATLNNPNGRHVDGDYVKSLYNGRLMTGSSYSSQCLIMLATVKNIIITCPLNFFISVENTSNHGVGGVNFNPRTRQNRTTNQRRDVPNLWQPEYIEEFYKAFGYPLHTFISYCWFGSRARGQTTCINNITEVYDTYNGKCFLVKVNRIF